VNRFISGDFPVPLFFDLTSAFPLLARNPFEPVVVADEVPAVLPTEEIPAEPIIDTGLPVPSHYDVDLMRVVVQDPFHLFVYWQLRDNPFDRLRRIFPDAEIGNFHTTLKLIDETNQIAVFFDAAYAREYWFQVFPDRAYRVELGVRSPQRGYIKMLTSNAVRTPRGAPSDITADEPQYQVTAEEYSQVLRESHLVPERAFTPEGILHLPGETEAQRADLWSSLPSSFRRLVMIISDVQAGRDYEKLWERLSRAEMAAMVNEFINVMRGMGEGETAYMLLLRYLPELLRRAIADEGETEIATDKPLVLYLAERLGQTASEFNLASSSERQAFSEANSRVPRISGGN
jgi:hypothetical protein